MIDMGTYAWAVRFRWDYFWIPPAIAPIVTLSI